MKSRDSLSNVKFRRTAFAGGDVDLGAAIKVLGNAALCNAAAAEVARARPC